MNKFLLTALFGVVSISCYAQNNIVPGTLKPVTKDLTIQAVSDFTADVTLVDTMFAGSHHQDEVIGTFSAKVPDGDWAARGDTSAADYDAPSFKWTTSGKNNPDNKLQVYMDNSGQISYGDLSGDGGIWRAFSSGTSVNIKLARDQTISADVYPITINFAKYER
ncbi:hypothetical protein [Serratia ureilytica]|uniref:hypothetical protein n=1 Tax=Serratia ureilytica TaxID=300181 RepID=UPI003F6BE96E